MKRINRKKIRKEQLYKKANGRCAFCGREISIDESKEHNDMCVCKDCSDRRKDFLSLEEYRNNLNNLIEYLLKNSSHFRTAYDYGLIDIKSKKVKFYFEKEK